MSEKWFEASSSENFFSKDDPDDPRLGNFVEKIELNPSKKSQRTLKPRTLALVGYPDDEGIKLNSGRPGAALGPDRVRQVFYKLTPSLQSSHLPIIHDFGNLSTREFSLDEKHAHAALGIRKLLNEGYRVATLGGGHDYGYPDFSAFCEEALSKRKRPFIINFDAHFDVRPPSKGAHSGTSFYKLLNKFSKDMDFFEIGIQDWCASKAHLRWLKEKGARVITLSEILSHPKGLEGVLKAKVFSMFKKNHALGLSVCLDAFSSAFSPGASQVFPTGLEPGEFLRSWGKMIRDHSPSLAGFYETSPAFDLDGRTSKLCAILVHQFVSN